MKQSEQQRERSFLKEEKVRMGDDPDRFLELFILKLSLNANWGSRQAEMG